MRDASNFLIRGPVKTLKRTCRFLVAGALWREPEYAPVVWALIGGWIWLLAELHRVPATPEIMLASLYFSVVLAAICAIDARYGIIPDSLVIAVASGGLLHVAFDSSHEFWLQSVSAALLEAALFLVAAWLFRAAYRRLRGQHGLGLGDVKLATAGVLWVGIETTPQVLLASVLFAITSLLILMHSGHQLGRQQAISFGPHLAAGFWLSWIAEQSHGAVF